MSILRNVAISESGFLFNPTTGDSFTLNDTAIHIVSLLKENKNKEEIISSIVDKFDVEKNTADKDYEDFVFSLKSYKLSN
ncbi:PqqD family protein [Flavobacterium sp. j3]|uniref:PqqD family protein n=1 Tax=Flavobacterium aureirubrum TaxID=3133147 RepID=A0ABU9N322_9FLAO|nr:PqqD family protein [Flavobacterium sp.]